MSRLIVGLTVVVLFAASGCSTARKRPNNMTNPPPPSPTTEAESQRARDAALAAYNGYTEAYVAASATSDPGGGELPKYVADPLLTSLKLELQRKNDLGLIVTGRPASTPRAIQVNVTTRPFSVDIEDCFDQTNWRTVYRATGKSAAAPGQAQRYVINAKTVQYDDGRWLVRQAAADRQRPC